MALAGGMATNFGGSEISGGGGGKKGCKTGGDKQAVPVQTASALHATMGEFGAAAVATEEEAMQEEEEPVSSELANIKVKHPMSIFKFY